MTFGKMTTQDLPVELRKQLVSALSTMGWRPLPLERVFANLEAQIIYSKKTGDYPNWRQCEDVGNKIRKWISEDTDREKRYLNDCAMSSRRDEDPYFYGK